MPIHPDKTNAAGVTVGMSVQPLAARPASPVLTTRLLWAGVVLSGLLMALTLWLSAHADRREPPRPGASATTGSSGGRAHL